MSPSQSRRGSVNDLQIDINEVLVRWTLLDDAPDMPTFFVGFVCHHAL